jgi:hypothetical protein
MSFGRMGRLYSINFGAEINKKARHNGTRPKRFLWASPFFAIGSAVSTGNPITAFLARISEQRPAKAEGRAL